MIRLDQLRIEGNQDKAKIYLVMPHFKYPMHLATLFRDSETLKLIPRSTKNVFHLFQDGLGFNEEMILKLNYKYVEAELNGKHYKTTKKHLIEKSIRSPYQNDKVDRQLILRLQDFNLPKEKEQEELQEELFSQCLGGINGGL